LVDEHIVAAATGKTARRVRIIFSAELNARNRLDDGHEFVAFDSIAVPVATALGYPAT
jgi:hypothetical protein